MHRSDTGSWKPIVKEFSDLNGWKEFSRRDDCLDEMVPSDLRMLIGEIERLQKTLAAISVLASDTIKPK